MANRPSHVPQFGNWNANDQIPYTVVFDNARAGRGGGMVVNPNDPEENPAALGLKSELSLESEESDLITSKQQHAGETARRQSGDAYSRAGATDGFKRGPGSGGGRENLGSEESANQQIYQGRLGNRPGSPYGERRISSEGGNPLAPTSGKSRLRPGPRPDETPDRGAALPKFGAWDESDPSTAEGYTVIFNQARNEKKTGGPARIPAHQGESPANPHYGDGYKQTPSSQHQGKKSSSIWSCCFGSQTSD